MHLCNGKESSRSVDGKYSMTKKVKVKEIIQALNKAMLFLHCVSPSILHLPPKKATNSVFMNTSHRGSIGNSPLVQWGKIQTKLPPCFSAFHGVTAEMYSERFRQMSLLVKTSIRDRMWGNNCRVERSPVHLFIIYKWEGNSFQCNPWLPFDLISQHHFPTQRHGPMLPDEELCTHCLSECCVTATFIHSLCFCWCVFHQKKQHFLWAKSFL